MPTLHEEKGTLVQVAASAPLELRWLLHFMESSHSHEGAFASLEPLRQRFGPELTALRADGLRTDRGLRKRYVELLSTVWRAVEPEWRREGRAAVLNEARRWSEALDDQPAGYKNLLGRSRLWPGRPDLDDLADAAAAEGKLTLNPCWFGGKCHILELDGAVLVGRGI